MRGLNSLWTATLAWACLGAATCSADVISAFSAAAVPGSGFTTVVNSTFNSSLARITNSSVACGPASACSGEVATFSLTLSDVTNPLAVAMGTLDGTMSGAGPVTGLVNLLVDGLPFKSIPLSLDDSPFLKDLFSTQVPTLLGSPLILSGSLSLTMPAGDSITLPNSLDFAIVQTPEPSYMALLACGLVGLAMLSRRMRRI